MHKGYLYLEFLIKYQTAITEKNVTEVDKIENRIWQQSFSFSLTSNVTSGLQAYTLFGGLHIGIVTQLEGQGKEHDIVT